MRRDFSVGKVGAAKPSSRATKSRMFSEDVLKKYPVYGPPARSWNWEQLSTKSFNARYSRRVEDQMEYQFHRIITQEFFADMEEYIKVSCIDPLESYTLIPNRFSYKVDDGIRHYLLWFKPYVHLTNDMVETILRERFPGCRMLIWQNSANQRSILTVAHYQIFVKSA